MGGDCFSQAWGSAPDARAYFLLLRQKKVAKKKATPGSAPLRGSLRYSALAGAAELGATPLKQSSPFFRQRLRCSAPLKGARTTSRLNRLAAVMACCGRQPKKGKNQNRTLSTPDGLPGPLRGAEQRRLGRKKGEHCLRGFSPELRSPRPNRVAQGTGAAGTDPGSPFLCLLSFGEAKESEPPRKGGNPCQEQEPPITSSPKKSPPIPPDPAPQTQTQSPPPA